MKDFARYADNLQKPGAVGVIPTDTIYGVAARASDREAVARLYSLKGRENKPGTIITSDIEQLEALGIKRRYLKAVEHFWPGAVSVIIPCADSKLKYLHCSKNSLAIRIPADSELQELLQATGPLLTSSANHPNERPANDIEEAKKYFGQEVDFYADGGDLSGREPSTIIRIVDDAIEILRQGAVRIDESGRET